MEGVKKGNRILAWTNLISTLGQFITRFIWLAVALIILSSIGKYLPSYIREQPSVQRTKPILDPIPWKEIDQAIVKALESSRMKAEQVAAVKLDAWIAILMQRVDSDFLDWYFSYWNQQMLGLKSLWYWSLNHVIGEQATAAEKITEEVQEEFAQRVLRPQIAQLELERITREVVDVYAYELRRNLEVIPMQYNIPQGAWERYLDDIAVISSRVEGNRRIDLSLKAITIAGAGGMLLATNRLVTITNKLGTTLATRLSGRMATRLATKTGERVISRVGGKLFGPIVGFGIILWDLWDHYHTKAINKPILRTAIADYFHETKMSLLYDSETGIFAVITLLEKEIFSSLRTS